MGSRIEKKKHLAHSDSTFNPQTPTDVPTHHIHLTKIPYYCRDRCALVDDKTPSHILLTTTPNTQHEIPATHQQFRINKKEKKQLKRRTIKRYPQTSNPHQAGRGAPCLLIIPFLFYHPLLIFISPFSSLLHYP